MTVTVGVVGTGSIGSDHVRRLSARVSGARVGAVFDVDTARADAVAAAAGARAHADALDVVDDPAVEAVVIVSPGDTHAALALACMTTGKPVLCEKPLATTGIDALTVLAAEVASGRRLVQVGFMRRFDAGYLRMKAALDSGAIGEALVLVLHCIHRNPAVPPAFTSDMALTDSVIHEIDAARWLLGEEIVGTTVVRTRRSPFAAGHLADPQLVLLVTGSGVVVEVEVFRNCRYGYDVRCEIVGATGTVSLEVPTTGAPTTGGVLGRAVPADWGERFGGAYHAELQQWSTACGPAPWPGRTPGTGTPPPPSPRPTSGR
jgi:myo-inositol 2-dehydrogenase/D-chiro-inositol 1-dehydrogenase